MAWERGYYYRVRKEGGRVVREYLGTGEAAEQAALLDANARQEWEARRAVRAELAGLDAALDDTATWAGSLSRGRRDTVFPPSKRRGGGC
jgi:hypothetical protein